MRLRQVRVQDAKRVYDRFNPASIYCRFVTLLANKAMQDACFALFV
jgi:hypothetical protein